MKNIIGSVLIIIFAAVGGLGGHLLKGDRGSKAGAAAVPYEESGDGTHEKDKGDHGKKKESHDGDDKHSDKKKDNGHGSSAYSSADNTEYYSFSREFVVPIMKDKRVDSLILLNINLEVQSSAMDKMFSINPKIRDNIMTTLVELSNDGKTLEDPTNVDSYETIRSMILLNLSSVVASGIENVLIMDIAKQDLG